MIYLDHAATTPLPEAVADTMYDVLRHQFGNPSAQYPLGREAKELVERIHDTANRRRVYIRISRHGLEMMDELKQSMLKSTTAALSAYSEDELEELDHCLCRLTKLMEKFNADGC